MFTVVNEKNLLLREHPYAMNILNFLEAFFKCSFFSHIAALELYLKKARY